MLRATCCSARSPSAGDRSPRRLGRLIYLGERSRHKWMAELLRAADFYVAPYLAEGFNLPVLEAAACGAPAICTAGGPTDDFTEPSFAWRIRSQLAGVRLRSGQIGECLKPDEEHLRELRRQAVRERSRARAIGAVGAAHAARDYTWDRVTERLLGCCFRDSPGLHWRDRSEVQSRSPASEAGRCSLSQVMLKASDLRLAMPAR